MVKEHRVLQLLEHMKDLKHQEEVSHMIEVGLRLRQRELMIDHLIQEVRVMTEVQVGRLRAIITIAQENLTHLLLEVVALDHQVLTVTRRLRVLEVRLLVPSLTLRDHLVVQRALDHQVELALLEGEENKKSTNK